MSDGPILHPVVIAVSAGDRALRGREKVATLSREARKALAQSARRSGLVLRELNKDARGAPLPSGPVHWSLSHKSAYVAAVAALAPVGVDLERIRPINRGLYDRIASPQEWRLGKEKDERLFARFWTAKEAVLKAAGQGLTGLSDCRVTEIQDDRHLLIVYQDTPWIVAQCAVGAEHLAAVTLIEQSPVIWHLPEEKE